MVVSPYNNLSLAFLRDFLGCCSSQGQELVG